MTGPIWSWAGGGSGLSLPTNANASTEPLQSPVQDHGVGALAPGQNSVTVTATATYTSTTKKTGVSTPIKVAGSILVNFFVTKPTKVVILPPPTVKVYNGQYAETNQGNGYLYGVVNQYNLAVLDNETMPKNYGNGVVQESFSKGSDSDAPTGMGDAWDINEADGTGSPTSTFTDQNTNVVVQPTHTPPAGYPTEDPFSFTQTFTDEELTPPYSGTNKYISIGSNPYVYLTPDVNSTLISSFNISDTWTSITRTPSP